MATTEQPPAGQNIIPTLTPEEIAQKLKNQEEIFKFYDSYKKLKNCISKKDANLMPELEQAYLSLISASRGCTSVQRLVAEFVPKYASYCPTALEAAAKACINIHNRSIENIKKDDDADGFSFKTARMCIFGLATICQAASSETPTSSVIQSICSAVFLNVLNFFISSLEGLGIFDILDKDVLKMNDSPEMFNEFKKKFSKDDDDEAAFIKLSKIRALCILWIFFSCPKNSLAACFELCSSDTADTVSNGGQYFLNQATATLDTQVSVDDSLSDDAAPSGSKSCLLSLVVDKDPSLRQWILSSVKSFSKSASPNVLSVITSAFEPIFESFTEQVMAQEKQVDSNADDSSGSKFIQMQSSDPADKLSGLHLEHHGSVTSEIDIRDKTSLNDSGGPKPLAVDTLDHKDLSRASSSTQTTNHFSSSTANKENHVPRLENGVNSNSNFESPKHRFPSWHCDGDRGAMEVHSASRHLWVGSLGPEASEPHVGFQFERFGPINKLVCVPFKGCAVIEYKNIMDAIKAREVMRGRSPWGACLVIKFLDAGLSTRGDTNGLAAGSCNHVYVGNIHSQPDKDEIMYELRKAGFKAPIAVIDLVNEGAVLMEFGNPQEAASVMAHLRQHRKEKQDFFQSPAVGYVDSRNNNLGNGIVSSPHGQTMGGFSHYGPHNTNTMELTSPRMNMVNQGATMQSGYPFQAGAPEQNWTYRNPESVSHATPVHGHNYGPSSYMRPMYYPPNTSWDANGMIHHNNGVAPPPFLPASVTPLAQMQGNSLPPHPDQMFYGPPPPHMPPPFPPQQNMPPPLPFHPELAPPPPPCTPPFFDSQPPPPPPPPIESSMMGSGGYWQGTLSKSGVHYSTLQARRLPSDACNYADNNISEPAEWPTKLDITKRTDFKHVMSTFSSVPPHKREVCQLLPTSAGDHKGFQDFISYLKQRECAGVIKIPATKTIWARLLFILPYSSETCTLLSVAPDTVDCLIALVLPKETNFEWV